MRGYLPGECNQRGLGVGVGAVNGEPVIEVYLNSGDPSLVRRLPAMLGDFRVRPIIIGTFKSLVKCQPRQ